MVNINEHSGITTSKFQMQDLPQDVAKVVDKMNVGRNFKAFTMINEKDGKEVCAIVKLKAKINGHKATIAEDYQDLKEISDGETSGKRCCRNGFWTSRNILMYASAKTGRSVTSSIQVGSRRTDVTLL